MRHIIGQLEWLAAASRVMLFTQRVAVLLAWVIGVIVALIAFDYALRLPATFRLIMLLLGISVFILAIWRYLLFAFTFAPSLTQIALRIERHLPDLAGRLASSIEFSLSGMDKDNALAAQSVHETESRLQSSEPKTFRTMMSPQRTARDVGIFVLVFALAGAVAVTNPAAAQTGLARLFVPWGGTMWPARTGVASLMHEVVSEENVHPRGQALPLRAEVTHGSLAQRITARYRIEQDGQLSDWQTVVLTRQGQSAVYERLVEAAADAIEVTFHSADDQTLPEQIQIVPPPEVRRASLTVTPPEYAAPWLPQREAELGPGVDSRAITDTPSLIGSHAELRLQLNKPLPIPLHADDAEQKRWLRDTFGWNAESLPAFSVDSSDAAVWHLRWQLTGTRTLNLNLIDHYGLRNTESIAYRIEAIEDQPPSVTITTPESDRSVLRSAQVPVRAETHDDVAVAELALHAERQVSGASRETPTMELWSESRQVDAPSGSLDAQLDLAAFELNEGDLVILTALTRDHYEHEGELREAVRSTPRRLRIISELEFASQLRRELSNVRQQAIRLETAQSELQDSIVEDGPQPGSERAQAQLAERIAAQEETIDEISEMVRINRLDDMQLNQLLDQSRDMLDFASRSASRAAEAIAERRDQQRAMTDEERERETERELGAPRDADRAIADAQQNVRDELMDLIALLDRDEDTWLVTRQLESLREQQQQLEQQTDQLARQTLGQSLDELSDADLSELDRIAQRQRELRDQAQQLLDDLRRRAEAMQDVDPQSASAMRTAAETGEQRELDRDMEAAADQVQQNQLRSARSGQQQAAETLQRMLRDIEETQRARAQELLRQLASLIESIERLITVQEREIMALAQAKEEDNYSGRDRSMIRLNQNTQHVASEARAAGQEARRIARTLDRAADAQGAAITALRAHPVRHDDAFEAEERSLELLKEARDLAEALQQQTEEQELRRQREELIAAYRELAERQIALREQTAEIQPPDHDGEPLTRRQLVEARRLGNSQEQLRRDLADVETTVREIADSRVFSHVHRRLDEWSREVSDALTGGDVTVDTTDRQTQIAQAIGRLIDALEETMTPPDDFDQDGGGGGGADGGQQPLIPPVAELRLLRGIQEEIYNHTKRLDTRTDLDEMRRRERLRDLGSQQRDLQRIGRELLEQLQQ